MIPRETAGRGKLALVTFTWPDPISLAADVVTFVGIPVLVVTTLKFYREYRNEAAERKAIKGVTEDHLEFYDTRNKAVVDIVPLDRMAAFPRAGDVVFLPNVVYDGRIVAGGSYEVERLNFTFCRPEPETDEPRLLKVIALVHKSE